MAMSVGLGLASMQDDNGNRIISLLSYENQALKAELEMCHTKVSCVTCLERAFVVPVASPSNSIVL